MHAIEGRYHALTKERTMLLRCERLIAALVVSWVIRVDRASGESPFAPDFSDMSGGWQIRRDSCQFQTHTVQRAERCGAHDL